MQVGYNYTCKSQTYIAKDQWHTRPEKVEKEKKNLKIIVYNKLLNIRKWTLGLTHLKSWLKS